MSPAINNCAWLAICLASIFICLKTEASPLTAIAKPLPVESFPQDDPFKNLNIEEEKDIISIPKNIVARSADADDNSVDDEDKDKDDKTEKPNSEEIFPDDNKNHHHNHHAHGSHGALGPVKHLLNTVRDRANGGGGVLGGLGNILGAHHANADHESPIETEEDRTMINSSTGLHVLEVLGTLFGLLWGFLSNIPALFGSSSSSFSGGQ